MSNSGVRRTKFAAYTLAIAHELTAHLSRIASLPLARLMGHAENFDFWSDEVAHCLAVIDSYPSRFDRMLAAQSDFQLNQPLPDFRSGEPFIPTRPTAAPSRIPDELRHYVRSELCQAFQKFAVACHSRAHLDPHCIRERCQRLGIDIAESDVPLA